VKAQGGGKTGVVSRGEECKENSEIIETPATAETEGRIGYQRTLIPGLHLRRIWK